MAMPCTPPLYSSMQAYPTTSQIASIWEFGNLEGWNSTPKQSTTNHRWKRLLALGRQMPMERSRCDSALYAFPPFVSTQ
eukprot:1751725-Pyramimonas_sp.AAC.1